MTKRLRGIPRPEKERRRRLRRRLRECAAEGRTEEAARIKAVLLEIEARRLSIRTGLLHGDEWSELNRGLTRQRFGVHE